MGRITDPSGAARTWQGNADRPALWNRLLQTKTLRHPPNEQVLGNYSIGDLRPGPYNLLFQDCGTGLNVGQEWYDEQAEQASATDVTVNPGAATDIDEDLPPNLAPVANDDAVSTGVGATVRINVLANDSDADGDLLTVTGVGDPSNGAATVNPDDTVTYDPDGCFVGTDTFTYTISDGLGGTDTALVTVRVRNTSRRIC